MLHAQQDEAQLIAAQKLLTEIIICTLDLENFKHQQKVYIFL